LAGLRKAIPKGKHLIVGFALLANEPSGKPIRGSFSRRPVSITISNRAVMRKAQVLTWNAARHRFVPFAAVVRTGRTAVATRHFAEFLVVSPG
jgi:hypothetical protein